MLTSLARFRMTKRLRVYLAAGLVLVALLVNCRPAEAQTGGIGPSKGQVVGALVGAAAAIVVITVVVVYAVRRAPTVTGCAVSGANGLTLENDSDHQSFVLNGETAGIKAGDRVKIQGKKQKADGTARGFTVLKVKRDYGACPAHP
jgi:hypothetical protein